MAAATTLLPDCCRDGIGALHRIALYSGVGVLAIATADDCGGKRPCYHFDVTIADTTPSAQAVHWQVQRAMTGEQRLLMALEMSIFARELQKARIRQEHPEWPDTEVARELLRLAFQPGLVRARLR